MADGERVAAAKKSTVELVLNSGKGIEFIADRLGISPEVLGEWTAQYLVENDLVDI